MDTVGLRDRFIEFSKKYKYAVIIVLVGVILMCLPGKKDTTKPVETQAAKSVTVQPSLSESLEQILAQIKGAGRVKVLLTESRGAETLYQVDEDVNTNADSSAIRRDVVLVTGADRTQQGLIRQVNPPGYLGAVVVCDGADNAGVRFSVVEAVKSVTGLGADHITVLKMK